ncbi:hypothetical protein ABZ690_28195 [Streptomyces sp. NPDC006967]|uniref:hypothetical protein n=1 Tax=Streptomyces sp. NPDC006967 TaxID=3156906 RepID=UPI0033FC5DDD
MSKQRPQLPPLFTDPATVQACASDLRTPAQQAAAAEDATAQAETAKWHAKQQAEAPGGRR